MTASSSASAGSAIRSFVAIELAGPARPALEEYLATLREIGADVAWTPPANLHLTLKFLGSVESERLARLQDRLATLAAEQPAFDLTVSGVGAFPSLRRPRVLWVGATAPPLQALAAAVDRACAAEGFALETRAFHPHVTLGRVRPQRRDLSRATKARRPARARARPEPEGLRRTPPTLDPAALGAHCAAAGDRAFGDSPADGLVLFRSRLSPSGARHEPLARLPFAASRPAN